MRVISLIIVKRQSVIEMRWAPQPVVYTTGRTQIFLEI
jgi:hypothetical protein